MTTTKVAVPVDQAAMRNQGWAPVGRVDKGVGSAWLSHPADSSKPGPYQAYGARAKAIKFWVDQGEKEGVDVLVEHRSADTTIIWAKADSATEGDDTES